MRTKLWIESVRVRNQVSYFSRKKCWIKATVSIFFDGDSRFTTFVGIIFEDLSPVKAYDKDRRSSPFENMSSSRVEFGKQGNLKGTPSFSSLSSLSNIQLRDRSDISITSRFIRTSSVKRERKYYRMK